jgi:hypothetical protein
VTPIIDISQEEEAARRVESAIRTQVPVRDLFIITADPILRKIKKNKPSKP